MDGGKSILEFIGTVAVVPLLREFEFDYVSDYN
jgi:hypothetical protein